MRLSLVTSLSIVIGVGLAPCASAQSRVTVVPAFSVASVYDDNVFAKKEGSAGHMNVFRPSLDATWESARLRMQGLGSFDMLRSNHSALNTLDARRNASLETTFRATPATALRLNASYDQTETPGELNFEGILGDRERARRVQVTPGLLHRINQRTSVSGSYDYIAEDLSGQDRMNLEIVRANYSHLYSSRDTVTAGYLRRHFDDGFRIDTSNAALVGWTRELASGTQLTIQGGPRFTTYDGIDPEFVGTLTRRMNRLRFVADYWHGETIVLGIHGPVIVDSGTVRFIWPFTRRIELAALAGVSDILTLDQRAAIDPDFDLDIADRRHVRSYRSSMVASWTPSGGPLTVAGSYGIDFQQGDLRFNVNPNSDIARHVFRVTLTIAPRLSRLIEPSDEGPIARPRR